MAGVGAVDNSKAVEKKCKICGKSVQSSEVKCLNEKCDFMLHSKCLDIITKVVNLDKKTFRCKSCYEEFKNSESLSKPSASNFNSELVILKKELECLQRERDVLNKYVAELEFSSRLLKLNFNDCQQKSQSSPTTFLPQDKVETSSYSAAVKRNINNTSAVLLVKTTDQNITNKQVEKDIKSQVNPGSLNANVLNTKLVKDGLLINCSDVDSLNKLKSCLDTKVGQKYNVIEPKKLNPRLIVYSVEKMAVGNPNLIEDIIYDNNLNVPTDNIKIVTKLKYKNVFNLILEVSPPLFTSLMKKEFLYISWKKCALKQHFSLPRCFKCWKFGHHKNNCLSQTTVCPRCSEAHEKKDCAAQTLSCNNCKEMNSKFKLNVPIEHTVNNPKCYFYLNKIEQIKSRINYGD